MKTYIYILFFTLLSCPHLYAQCIDESYYSSAGGGTSSEYTEFDTAAMAAIEAFFNLSGWPQEVGGVVGNIDTIFLYDCVNYEPDYLISFFPNFYEPSPTLQALWIFSGADVATSDQEYPKNITYIEVGKHLVHYGTKDKTSYNYGALAILVIDHLPKSNFAAVAPFCVGECVSFTDQSAYYPTTWQWHFEGGSPDFSFDQHPKDICYSQPGIYTARLITHNTAGTDTSYQTIQVLDEFSSITTQSYFSIYEGSYVALQACASAESYDWQPAKGLSCTDCPNPIVTPQESSQYTCTITADGFCTTECSYTVHIKQRQIVVPTAFSPNGDGINDRLIMLEDGTTLQHFAVYNRWGQLVYQTNDISQTWDGSHKSQPAEMGVYVWVAQHQSEQGIKGVSKGSVTIIW